MNVWETLKNKTQLMPELNHAAGAGGQMVCVWFKITGKKVTF